MATQEQSRIRTLVVATANPGKLEELSAILPPSIQLLSLRDVDASSPEETGRTFLDNALLKAEHASRGTGLAALADDSGLEVTVLDGRPGVHSARYAGSNATDDANNRKLIADLKQADGQPWSARFTCAVACCIPGEPPLTAMGHLYGVIVAQPRGTHGFGYDPHFELRDPDVREFDGMTLAELSPHDKNRISHRKRAIEALRQRARELSRKHPASSFLVDND